MKNEEWAVWLYQGIDLQGRAVCLCSACRHYAYGLGRRTCPHCNRNMGRELDVSDKERDPAPL